MGSSEYSHFTANQFAAQRACCNRIASSVSAAAARVNRRLFYIDFRSLTYPRRNRLNDMFRSGLCPPAGRPRRPSFSGAMTPVTDQQHHQHAIEKADVLIEALGWIRRFRDKVTVIKLGGSVMEDADALRHLLVDIVFMETVGMRPVVVHGGGAAISRAMDAAGLKPRVHPGPPLHRRRHAENCRSRCWPTKPANTSPHRIEEFGGRAMPLNFRTTNVLFGERITARRTTTASRIDLGHVGNVTRVDRTTIENLCYAGRCR